MHAAWLSATAPVHFREDLSEPVLSEGDALVKVVLAGICATDLALAAGYMDFDGVPGHEFVGRALNGPLQGQRVVGEINAGCGVCPVCKNAQKGLDERHCPNRSVLGILQHNGAFAEHLVLPARNLLVVPENVSDRAAVFVEPLAAAFQILEQLSPAPVAKILVAGDGRLGLLIAKVLIAAGHQVDLAGHHPERTPPGAKDRCGLLDQDCEPAFDERYDIAVEATGSPDVLARLIPWLRPKGCLVLKTTSGQETPLDLTRAVVEELTIIGSRCGPFDVALDALSQGHIEVESMIHATLPLSDVAQAFDLAATPGVLKVLIDCQSSKT